MKSIRQSQADKIISLLATGRRMSKLDFIKAGCGLKADTRISELRRDRHLIKDEWVQRAGARFKRYYLDKRH